MYFRVSDITYTRNRCTQNQGHVTVTPASTLRSIRRSIRRLQRWLQGVTPGVGIEGYIRTLIHVLSSVLRLQSYIVTCVYLLDYCDSLLDYNLTTLTSRPIPRYRSTRRSHWHRSSISQQDLGYSKALQAIAQLRQIVDVRYTRSIKASIPGTYLT